MAVRTSVASSAAGERPADVPDRLVEDAGDLGNVGVLSGVQTDGDARGVRRPLADVDRSAVAAVGTAPLDVPGRAIGHEPGAGRATTRGEIGIDVELALDRDRLLQPDGGDVLRQVDRVREEVEGGLCRGQDEEGLLEIGQGRAPFRQPSGARRDSTDDGSR